MLNNLYLLDKIKLTTYMVMVSRDKDGVDDYYDNCKGRANAAQVDSDGDGTGEFCLIKTLYS